MQRQRGLARALRPVNLDDPAARETANAQGEIQPKRAGGYHLDLLIDGALAHAHDRALAERPLDLRQRSLKRLVLLHAFIPLACHVRLILPTKSSGGEPVDISASV
jgi:hypothetical protein